ncbi:MAG: hypothetical protein PHE51_08280 [Eubacteriales bacterium]|nr:hypothetical protein [Eubacteriales bacterium]
MAFIGALLIGLYLLLVSLSNSAQFARANSEYKRLEKKYNFNTERQNELLYRNDAYIKGACVFLDIDYQLNPSTYVDVYVKDCLKKEGYDFNPSLGRNSIAYGMAVRDNKTLWIKRYQKLGILPENLEDCKSLFPVYKLR